MRLIDFDKKDLTPAELNEVRMSPTQFAKFMLGPDTKDIRVGFEFELCIVVPGAKDSADKTSQGIIWASEKFTRDTGIDSRPSLSYHSANRKLTFEQGKWIVEIDGSITPAEVNDIGLEFISPPMSLDSSMEVLKTVTGWARQNSYTNSSTGLHINISIPGLTRKNIDFVKLAIFLGDEYLLKLFRRENNGYTRSSIKKIKSRIRILSNEALVKALDEIRQGAVKSASEVVHEAWTDKYTSINVHDEYIEFRSPGGNYLDMDLEKITNSMIRMAIALKIAADPQSHKQEYLKKFYKLISSELHSNSLDETDEISKLIKSYLYGDHTERQRAIDQLRGRARRRQSLRAETREWKLIDGNDQIVHTFFAKNYDDAVSQVLGIRPMIGNWGPLWVRPINWKFGDPYDFSEDAEKELIESWSEKYKRSINCQKPRGFSQRAHCQGRKKHTEDVEHTVDLIDAIRDFLPLAMKELGLDHLPKITFRKDVHGEHAPTFGKFVNEQQKIFIDIENRHPNDICRTLAHELTHYKQLLNDQLHSRSGETGSDEENEANATAGIIMRNFNKKYPQYLTLEPVILHKFHEST